MNQIPIDQVYRELGEGGVKEIEQLTSFLYSDLGVQGGHDRNWREHLPREARIAQSIVIRSEGKLFGISSPRFAFRLYFPGEKAFVNCRSLRTLQKILTERPNIWSGSRNPELPVELRHPSVVREIPNNISEIPTRNASVIADCLLSRPARYSPMDYHINCVNLYKEYGEIGGTEGVGMMSSELYASPFVRAVRGPGECAMASCFIATTLLHRYSTTIRGLDEIAALGQERPLRELLLTGMTADEMVRYFLKVGLNAQLQICNPDLLISPSASQRNLMFEQTLRAYVTSGMPVILLVDRARLDGYRTHGAAIYATNGLKCGLKAGPNSPHALTVIGCKRQMWRHGERDKRYNGADFIFHDTSTMPFMSATLDQINEVGAYSDEVPDHARQPAMIAVLPPQVKVPLLRGVTSSANGAFPGLWELSRMRDPKRVASNDRHFIVSRLDEVPLIRIAEYFTLHFVQAVIDLIKNRLQNEASNRLGWRSNHWIWLECDHNSLTIWDAERTPDRTVQAALPSNYLVAKIDISNSRPTFRFYASWESTLPLEIGQSDIPQPVASVSEPRVPLLPRTASEVSVSALSSTGSRLEVSLMSSFALEGVRSAARVWPTGTRFVEYCPCVQDVIEFASARKGDEGVRLRIESSDLISQLGARDNNPRDAFTFARKLGEAFGARQIAAISIVVPELLSPDVRVWNTAQKALRFLVQVARHLCSNSRPFNIVLAIGTRLYGLWAAQTLEGNFLAANILDRSTALRLLLNRLRPVAELACETPGLQLAMELESGPFFTLNDARSLLEFCQFLDEDPILSRVVGLNLDIPSWAFDSSVSTEWLRNPANATILSRIIHSHISDRSSGHFSDSIPGSFHPLQAFKNWIALLDQINRDLRRPDFPRYSGLISCEVEGCKTLEWVTQSLSTVRNICENLTHHPDSTDFKGPALEVVLEGSFESFSSEEFSNRLRAIIGQKASKLSIESIRRGSIIVRMTGDNALLEQIFKRLKADNVSLDLSKAKCVKVLWSKADGSKSVIERNAPNTLPKNKTSPKTLKHEMKEFISVSKIHGKIDFGIITVRKDEFEALLSRFTPRLTVRDGQELYAYSKCRTNDKSEVRIAIVRCLEQGQERAQAVATAMIGDLRPKWLLLVGIAGGMPSDDYSLGDVILTSRLHDFSVSAALQDRQTQYNVAGGPFHHDVEEILAYLPAVKDKLGDWNSLDAIGQTAPPVSVPTDDNGQELYGSIEWRKKVRASLLQHFGSNNRKGPKYWIGATASSGTLVKDSNLAESWLSVARAISNVEMELSGVYAGTRFATKGEPRVIAIRALSDIVGYRRDPAWTNYACISAAAFAHAFVRSGIVNCIKLPRIRSRL